MRWALAIFVGLASAQAADWPQFLGPQRDGAAVEAEAALPDSFKGEPKPLWNHKIGTGHSGPVVAGDKTIIFHRQEGDVVVDALDALTGEPRWQQRFPTDYRDDFGMDNGPRAVPTIADNRIFLHGADGMLRALDLASGEMLWQVDTQRELDSPQGFFGRACAPLVADGKVIITTGGKAAVTAFDVKTGKTVWSGGEDEASYASPVMLNDHVILAWLRDHLTTFSIADGKLIDKDHYRPEIDASVSAATPIKTNAGWFLTAEYDVGCSLWDISDEGKLKKTWSDDSLLNAHYATPVYHDGCVYGFDGRQERGMTLLCLDLKTKKVRWESPQVRGGTLLRVKDKLAVLTEEGELWVVRATPEKFDQLLATQVLRANHRSYAAYANGIWYARDGGQLIAVRLNTP